MAGQAGVGLLSGIDHDAVQPHLALGDIVSLLPGYHCISTPSYPRADPAPSLLPLPPLSSLIDVASSI